MKNIIASMIILCFAATSFADLKSGLYDAYGGCSMSVFSSGDKITVMYVSTRRDSCRIRTSWTFKRTIDKRNVYKFSEVDNQESSTWYTDPTESTLTVDDGENPSSFYSSYLGGIYFKRKSQVDEMNCPKSK